MQLNRRVVWQAGSLLSVWVGVIIAVSPSQPGLASSNLISSQFSWKDFLSFLQRPRRDKGGKGVLCLLVPSDEEEPLVMWHDRPLFIWRGVEQTIGLRRSGSEAIFWRQSLRQPGESVNRIQYVGLNLQPGTTYELLLFSSPIATQPVRSQPFVVMSKFDRASVTSELQALTATLKKERSSDETIAQRRTQYFLDRKVGTTNLQADSLQEIYSVKKPSVALNQVMVDIPKKLCGSP